MSITLDALEAAVFARLQTRAANGAALTASVPFRSVARWAGEVTAEEIAEGHLGSCPSALLAYEGSQAVVAGDRQFVHTLGHDVEVVERHIFRVYVTVQDTRGDTATLKGGTGTPGIYACTQAVAEALAGWRIAGLQGGGVLALIDRVPWRIARGESRTDVVRFAALATLPETTEVTAGARPLSRVDATVRHEEADVDSLPINLSTSRTTT
jgi:hypothetical protein